MLLQQEASGTSEMLLLKASTQQQVSSLQQEPAATKKQPSAKINAVLNCSRGCRSTPLAAGGCQEAAVWRSWQRWAHRGRCSLASQSQHPLVSVLQVQVQSHVGTSSHASGLSLKARWSPPYMLQQKQESSTQYLRIVLSHTLTGGPGSCSNHFRRCISNIALTRPDHLLFWAYLLEQSSSLPHFMTFQMRPKVPCRLQARAVQRQPPAQSSTSRRHSLHEGQSQAVLPTPFSPA